MRIGDRHRFGIIGLTKTRAKFDCIGYCFGKVSHRVVVSRRFQSALGTMSNE